MTTASASLPPIKLSAAARKAGLMLQSGREHLRKQRWPQAARDLGAAVQVVGGSMHDWLGLAVAHAKSGSVQSSIDAARRALELDPASLACREVLAQGYLAQQRHAEAEGVYAQAPEGSDFDHNWLVNHGICLVHCGRAEEAVTLFLRAIGLKLDSVVAYVRLGAAFKHLKMFQEAVECFRTAVALQPGNLTAQCFLVHMDQFACRWEHFDEDVAALLAALDAAEPGDADDGMECTPFALVSIPHAPAAMKRAAELEARRQARGIVPFKALPATPALPRRRLRVGYLSSDMHQHATAMLMAEMLEGHDRERFEIFMYSHGKSDASAMRARLERGCEHFVDVVASSAQQTAERIRADALDLLVDLKGYTQNHRFKVMSFRPAPLQATWLGFPGTTGAACIDYFIGDRVVTPLAHAPHFSEKLAQLPGSYQPNDRARPLPAPTSRAQWGLPEGVPVVCCFNNVYKITPPVFARWMQILRAVPDAVLWLLDSNAQAKANLAREAGNAGVAAERLLFAPAIPPQAHLTRLQCADLMLDTWPCNAHTTASDALWAGLPVLTLPGETFASRVAASLLHAAGLPQLVCADADEYACRAIALLQERGEGGALHAMRAQLVARRFELPLFDGRRFAREIEALYLRMHERRVAGLPPDHLRAGEPAAPTLWEPAPV